MNTQDLYKHKHFGHLVQITAQAGTWIEFLNQETQELNWLEDWVFEGAYEYSKLGDPIQVNLPELRRHAQGSGLLVPHQLLS